jgi:hypothetical protein
MPITQVQDIFQGSALTVGVSSNDYDRAIRRFWVSGLENVKGGLNNKAAINYVLDHANDGTVGSGSNNHPAMSTLPIQDATAVLVGPTKAMVTLRYARRNISVPSQPAILIADFETFTDKQKWYSHSFDADGNPTFDGDGLPIGLIAYDNVNPTIFPEEDPRAVPKAWERELNGYDIAVPTVLDFNPASDVEYLTDKTNSDSVTFGGLLAPPNTMLFRGLSSKWYDTSEGNRWSVVYYFTFIRQGFWTQVYENVYNGGVFVSRSFIIGKTKQQESFANAFPVHS